MTAVLCCCAGTNENLIIAKFTINFAFFFRIVSLGPRSLLFSRPHYDSVVHTPHLGFRETATLTEEELLNLTIIENSNADISKKLAALPQKILLGTIDWRRVAHLVERRASNRKVRETLV